MTIPALTSRLLRLRSLGSAALLAVVAAGAGLVVGTAPLAAQEFTYNRKAMNDLSECGPSKGPAVRVAVSGLKSSSGYLFVRTYPARSSDWLKSKRYVVRVEATPKQGSMTVCVPLPAPGDYAIAVQHDANGNRETDFSTDGAGMSNNPEIRKFLGIPRPPSVDKVRFTAGKGITPIAITVRYL